jgi:hypothetical protein
MKTLDQTVFFVIETKPGVYLANDGKGTRVLDEAWVFSNHDAAWRHSTDGDAVRKIECVAGHETRLV